MWSFAATSTSGELEALYVLAVTTGMRQGELLGLRWRDVDLDARALAVRVSLQRIRGGLIFAEPKTASSRRRITLTELALVALRRRRAAQIAERLAAGPAALPRIRFHDLRLTAATLMLSRGVLPKVASQMLGHSTIAITLDLYSHVTPTIQRDAADAVDAILSGAL